MTNVLSTEAARVLASVDREEMLLAFDFDGTLAPIVEAPVLAEMRPSTKALLRLVALMYPCAVVSGRSRADLLPRVGGVPLAAVVGNHGAEPEFAPVNRWMRRLVASWARTLETELRGLQGVDIEEKGLSVAVHYRRAPSRAAARRAIRAAAGALDESRVFGGRAVVNVVPAGAHDKGTVLEELLARLGLRRALYVGDDVTDEDAFRSKAVAVSIRVGHSSLSAARYFLPSQKSIDDLLRVLARAPRLHGARRRQAAFRVPLRAEHRGGR